jgi:hypothetical protein
MNEIITAMMAIMFVVLFFSKCHDDERRKKHQHISQPNTKEKICIAKPVK